MDDDLPKQTGEDAWEFFYEKRVPEPDELVMVRVNSIDDMGVMCSLLEYNDLEGFLPLSEISRKRMRSVLRHVRVGQKQVLQVLRVDTERGYVDLSKKYVGAQEKELGSNKFEKGKHVHSIAKRLAEVTHQPTKATFEKLIFPLYQQVRHPYEGFKAFASEDEDIFSGIVEGVTDEIKAHLKKIVVQRMAVQPVKLGSQIELTCYSFAGIEDIKRALHAGLDAADANDGVKIQLISSPVYLVWLQTIDEEKGKKILGSVITAVKEDIAQSGGNLNIIKDPQPIGKDFDVATGASI